MIEISGKPLLSRLATRFNDSGIRDITAVRGYKKAAINLPNLRYVDNDDYDVSGELSTLAAARDKLVGPVIVSYGDILFRQYVLDILCAAEGDAVIVVDAVWQERDSDPTSRTRDLVHCNSGFNTGYVEDESIHLAKMGPDLDGDAIHGEWIGLAKFSAKGATIAGSHLDAMVQDGSLQQSSMVELFNRLVASDLAVRVIYITGHWLDVDNANDLNDARKFL